MKRMSIFTTLAMVASLIGLVASPASAATLTVDDDGVECPAPDHATIGAAVAAASSGDTINVCDGAYAEHVTIDTSNLTILGQGPGTVVAPPSSAAFTLNGNADGLELASMRIDAGTAQHGVQTDAAVDEVVLRELSITGASQRAIYVNVNGIAQDWVMSQLAITGNATGMRIRGQVYGMMIDDSQFNANTFGITVFSKDSATSTAALSWVEDLIISDSEFNDNTDKGLYFESLDTALFDNIEVLRSGTRPGYNAGAGLDINVKWQDFENITIQDSRVEDNGSAFATFGGGLTIKARDDAPSYSPDPATLSGVWVTNTVVAGNVPVGIRFGEPGKTNAGPTDAHVNFGSITDNTGNGLENVSVPLLDGTCNWWGSSSGPGPVGPGTGDEVSNNVDYDPWLTAPAPGGTCNGGQPVPTSKNDCKEEGWMSRGDADGRPFANQGDCVSYLATGGKNKAGG